MMTYLQKRTRKGNYLYWIGEQKLNTLEINEGNIFNDKKSKTTTFLSEEDAIEALEKETSKKKKAGFKKTDFRIVDLLEICFRDISDINDLVKLLKKLNIKDIRKLNTHNDATILRLLEFNGSALKYIKKPSDKMINTALNQNGIAIRYIQEPTYPMKKQAVMNNGMALKYIEEQTDDLKQYVIESGTFWLAYSLIESPNEEMITTFLRKGISLRDIDTDLKKERNFAINSIEISPDNYMHIHKSLKKDKEIALIALIALKRNSDLIGEIDKQLFHSKEFLLEAVEYCHNISYYAYFAKSDLLKDKEFMLKAVSKSGTELEYADDSLKKDKEVVLEALKQDLNAIDFVYKDLRVNKDIIAMLNG